MNPPSDPTAAADFLARRYGDRASGVVEIGRGAWATAFGFMLDGQARVARFGALADDFEKDRVAASYNSPALPIPRIIDIGEAPGGFYAISERAEGVHLDELDEAGMRGVLPGLFAAHDAMRCVDLSHTTGYGMWDATGNAPHATWCDALLALPDDGPNSRLPHWRERLDAYPDARAAFDEGLAALRQLVLVCPSGRHLIHSDPINRNVLVADGHVTAVLDWGCGMYGDFLYELAHFTFGTLWFPAWNNVDFAGEAERHYAQIGLDVPAMRERLRCYEVHIGVDAILYNAFRQRPDHLEPLVRRTRELTR